MKELASEKVETLIYDAIFVCNGHNSVPSLPVPPYPGSNRFRGRQSHSHTYRRASEFEGDLLNALNGIVHLLIPQFR